MLLRPQIRKSMGQVFLTNRDVAMAEAVHGHDKNVLEIGPGKGMLTRELCEEAKRVVAVEKDGLLYNYLRGSLECRNLRLINADFFDLSEEALGLASIDIMISNVPYSLSSSVIAWLSAERKEAVLCLQKEFVEHMLAREGTANYSRLSVVSSLSFSMTEIMDVSRGCFYPIPKVDSEIVYLKPKEFTIKEDESMIINLLMQHKKKRVKNAIADSRIHLRAGKKEIAEMASSVSRSSERVFQLSPDEILGVAKEILELQKE